MFTGVIDAVNLRMKGLFVLVHSLHFHDPDDHEPIASMSRRFNKHYQLFSFDYSVDSFKKIINFG